MIQDLLTEKEILDYLMTSDFNEGLTKEESKFLLLKYRNFYRATYAKNEQLNFRVTELESRLKSLNVEISSVYESLSLCKSELEVEKARDLTWKERITGKKIKN
jgi:hypothetical protein